MAVIEIKNAGIQHIIDTAGPFAWIDLDAAFHVAGALSAVGDRIVAVSHTPPFYDDGFAPDGETPENAMIALDGTFAYGPLNTVTGTVTALTVTFDGAEVMTVTGLDADAGDLWLALLSFNASDHLPVIFAGDDSFAGSSFADRFRGGDGNDELHGFGRSDDLHGQRGADSIFGGDGNDYLYGGGGNDMVKGDNGRDDIYGGTGADRLFGGAGRDWLQGGGGNDRLVGGAQADQMWGGAGDDILRGAGGNDQLRGGAGDDTLVGGWGKDRFIFDFGAPAGPGDDVIEDFAVGDRIVLSAGRLRKADVEVSRDGSDVLVEAKGHAITVENARVADVEDALVVNAWF